MLSRVTMYKKVNSCLFLCTELQAKIKCLSMRNIQVSVIGAAGEVGSNLALLLKQNHKIRKLNLHDDDQKIDGVAMELSHLPGGPEVSGYAGFNTLHSAIQSSHLIVMVHRVPRKPGNKREQMIAANAPPLQRLCRAMADANPGAFLAISTNPLNSLVPFASALLYKYGAYNPFKVLGVTHIDTARARTYASNALQLSCKNLYLPVIGGHSDETVIPLFSNITPMEYCIDPCQADTLTRLVRKSGTEIIYRKHGYESAVLGVAWSVNEFCNSLIDAIRGDVVEVNCYSANPHFGTRFFSGPTTVGPYGIVKACHDFSYSDYESFLVSASVPFINKDVCLGEDYVRYIEFVMKPTY